MISLTDALN